MKRLLLVLLCTIFSLPVFAQQMIIIKTKETKVFKDRCVSMEEASKYVSTETLEAIREGRFPDVCLNPRKGFAMMQSREKNEDVIARKNGCVTRDEARAFATEWLHAKLDRAEKKEHREVLKELIDDLNKKPGTLYEKPQEWWFSVYDRQVWNILTIYVSCDGEKVGYVGNNR